MFYTHNILTKKGSLGLVWIAANFQPGVHHISLTRRQYSSVSIGKACEEVVSPRNQMALRLSANLMVGIVRIHSQQTHYIYGDSKQVWQRLKHAYEKNRPTIDLPTSYSRRDAVTLPDPTTQMILDASFPGRDYSFSLDSLLVTNMFSMTNALPTHTPITRPLNNTQGSPFTANPRDISMEEENEAPLESLQIQVPGEGGDFGDGVQVEGGREGHVVMMDDVPMPCLNTSDSMSIYGGVGDVSFESVGGGVEGKTQVVKEVEEEEEEGGRDSVLLFDEQTDSFQLYNEEQHKAPQDEQGTPAQHQPEQCAGGGGGDPLVPVVGGGGGGARRGRRARRRLAFDQLIKTKSTTVRENIDSAHTTLRDKHTLCHPVPARVKPAVLLNQPTCRISVRNPQLLSPWHHSTQTPPDFNNQPEFEIEQLQPSNSAPVDPSLSLLPDTEMALGGHSTSHLPSCSPGGRGSALELAREGDDPTMDSHHTTGLTAIFSDVSSFASGRGQTFDTSSAQRQTSGLHRRPLPALMEGLSPIADQTEASFDTQDGGDLGFPGFDVSNSSPGDPQRNIDEAHSSPVLESEPQAYLSHVVGKMGERPEVEFRELLPANSSRRTASRAFSHILELVTSQVLTVTQHKPYDTIKLQRGHVYETTAHTHKQNTSLKAVKQQS